LDWSWLTNGVKDGGALASSPFSLSSQIRDRSPTTTQTAYYNACTVEPGQKEKDLNETSHSGR